MNNNILNSLNFFLIKHFYIIAFSIENIGCSKKSFLPFQVHGNNVVTERLLSRNFWVHYHSQLRYLGILPFTKQHLCYFMPQQCSPVSPSPLLREVEDIHGGGKFPKNKLLPHTCLLSIRSYFLVGFIYWFAHFIEHYIGVLPKCKLCFDFFLY